ncbi:MAG: tetratricopeptide repeat protein, partial [Chloroflexota bacterium]
YQTAAAYQQVLYKYERPTVNQAMITHQALTLAEQQAEADRLALDDIVGPMSRAGLYHTLLDEWLPPICQSPDPQTKAEALGQQGKQLLHIADYDTALDFLKQSLAIQKEIGDKSGEGTTLNNISQIYDARGDYDTALDFLKQSLAIQKEIGDKAGEGTTLNNMATTAHARGDYDTALDFLKQSLAIQKDIGDKSGEGTTLNNISGIYRARGDYDTALDFLKQSLAIQKDIGDKSGEGTTLNNISQIYDARGDYDTALDFLKQSLAISQDIGDISGLCATLFNMGHIHWQNEEQQEALGAWVAVYQLAKPRGLSQALQALESLAGQLVEDGGLALWEGLSQQISQGMGEDTTLHQSIGQTLD